MGDTSSRGGDGTESALTLGEMRVLVGLDPAFGVVLNEKTNFVVALTKFQVGCLVRTAAAINPVSRPCIMSRFDGCRLCGWQTTAI